jgi:hypothetical protein
MYLSIVMGIVGVTMILVSGNLAPAPSTPQSETFQPFICPGCYAITMYCLGGTMTIAGVYLCNNQVRTIYTPPGTTSFSYTPPFDIPYTAGGCTLTGTTNGSRTLTISGGCGIHL